MAGSPWLTSDRAYRLFSAAAWTVVALAAFMTFMLTPWFRQMEAVGGGELFLRLLAAPLGIFGALASLILLFGMAAFCIREDRSSISTKVLWFVIFFVTAMFGTAVYFFAVYKKQIHGARVPA